jgi:sugar lactone lactonase YvrE
MSMQNVSVLISDNATLGEGPLWDERKSRLYWVDIKQCRLNWLDWDAGDTGRIELAEEISAIALAGEERLLCARRSGLYLLDMTSGEFEFVTAIEPDTPGNRPNDGGVDPLGRFWIGTMDDAEKNVSGALHCWDGHNLRALLEGVGVANGVGWSRDGKTMYFTDSRARTISTLRFDTASGEISDRQTLVVVPDGMGFPDGLSVDSEDHVWSVHWDGGRITRYAPDGSVERAIDLPVTRPTACTFAGPRLDHLVVTSARIGLTAQQLAQQPHAGSVLCLKPGVTGVASRRATIF